MKHIQSYTKTISKSTNLKRTLKRMTKEFDFINKFEMGCCCGIDFFYVWLDKQELTGDQIKMIEDRTGHKFRRTRKDLNGKTKAHFWNNPY